MLKFDVRYNILNTVAQIFELDESVRVHTAEEFTHIQLMLCEENSNSVETTVQAGKLYVMYTFSDKSIVALRVKSND